jgi:hypothetical protein
MLKGGIVMEISIKQIVASDLQALSDRELDAINGGVMPMVSTEGMPDRSVMCGTMWYQQQLLKLLGLGR